MVEHARLRVALANIDPAAWRLFERLATAFLADEFPGLRPMASMSGDEGKDAILYVPDDDPEVVVQYSVARDWDDKIAKTCRRLKETAPDTRVLVYTTSQVIGGAAADVARRMRKNHGIYVDIRDREWFLANRNAGPRSKAESEEFSRQVADPIIGGDAGLERKAQALSDLEAKAAFVYLGLQWADETREKGLTRLCFEAVVRAVLRDTDSDHRIDRNEIYARARKVLPAQDETQLRQHIDRALTRLNKVHVRHWKKFDEFCLTYEERTRLAGRLLETEALDEALTEQLKDVIEITISETKSTADADVMLHRTRRVLERVLLERGAAFAEAVNHDRGAFLAFEDVDAVVSRDFIDHPPEPGIATSLVIATIQQLLAAPSEEVQAYLRGLADTYTLFAFMRETPDVQSAIVKIFSEGDIWLDTTVVLPLLAENLLPEWEHAHTRMMAAAVEAGLNLYVTTGVVEEIVTHINRCERWSRLVGQPRGADGQPPFLYTAFKLAGRSPSEFPAWLSTFRGQSRPTDDVMDYLEDIHGIQLRDLAVEVDTADETLKAMISEIWYEARERRQEEHGRFEDPSTRARMVAHDVENFLGVIQRRVERHERRSAFGYKSWWLTLDRTAFSVCNQLKERIDGRVPASPAISPDFMLTYLAIGPVRRRLTKHTEEALPLMLNMSVMDAVPQVLLDLADELRAELVGLAPHVVDRRIRDMLDEARRILGAVARAGESGLTDEIKKRLLDHATGRAQSTTEDMP